MLSLSKKAGAVIAQLPNALMNFKLAFLFLIFSIGAVYSSIIPPFQSPDEYVHVSRAYLFLKGKIILDAPANSNSGGLIDNGLIEYIKSHARIAGNPLETLSREEVESSKDIGWTHTYRFFDVAGAAYYFPAIYTPHALGLLVGEHANLTVDQSYRLARFFAFGLSILIIIAAFKLVPPNLFTVGLLILPMSLFQIVSASIDGLTTAMSILTVSLFIRGSDNRYEFPSWMAYLLAVTIFIIATSRIHLLPLVAFPFVIYLIRRCKISLWSSLSVAALSILWMAVAVKTTSDMRVPREFSTSYVIGHYVTNPFAFLHVLATTAADTNLTEFYKNSFVGILGWLDTPFEAWFYQMTFTGLGLIALFSISFNGIKKDYISRAVLISVAGISALLIFFALLVTWTPHPAQVVSGVQGRYFIVPVILLGYALSGNHHVLPYKRSSVPLLLLVAYGLLVSQLMPQLLISRYYAKPAERRSTGYSMKPSAELKSGTPITLHLTPTYADDSVRLTAVAIMLGTYSRKNAGHAELRLYGKEGNVVRRDISLSELRDNRYYRIEVESKQYLSGEIASTTGVGISSWEIHDQEGNIKTCAIYEYSNGRRQRTSGCPKD